MKQNRTIDVHIRLKPEEYIAFRDKVLSNGDNISTVIRLWIWEFINRKK